MRRCYYSGMATFDLSSRVFLLLVLSSFRSWGADITSSATPGAAPSDQANTVAIVQAQQRALDAENRRDVPGLVQALNDEAAARLRAHECDAGENLRLRVLHLQEEHAGRD